MLKKLKMIKADRSQFKLLLILLLFGLASVSQIARADEYSPELTGSLGISQISFAETESQVENNGQFVKAQTGSVSIITLDINYKFSSTEKIDYFTRISAPFLAASGNTYLAASVGGSYYFGTQNVRTELTENNSTIRYMPKLRYFAGVELGIGFLVFSNEIVKRNDTLFNVGFHGGASYTVAQNWAARASLHFARGTGTNTATTTIQFFGGMTYFF